MITIRMLQSSSANGRLVSWDRFVEAHPNGSFYHLSGWQTIFEEVFNHQTFFLYADRGNHQICGVLPLILLKNVFGQRFLISLPFLSYSGLLADSEEVENMLIKKTISIGMKYDVQYIELRQYQPIADIELTRDNYVSPLLELNNDDEIVWKNSLNTKVRNKIRQSFRQGVKIDFGDRYFDEFYEIFAKTMHRLGTPVHHRSLFLKMKEVFGNRMILLVAKEEKEVISGMILFNFANKVLLNPWSASLAEYKKLRPNNAMYWKGIEYGCKNEFQYFDFGRSTIGVGTYNFKKQWGPEPRQLFYQYVLLNGNTVPQTDANDNKYEKMVGVWQRLPYGFTKAFGPQIVKYLPEL